MSKIMDSKKAPIMLFIRKYGIENQKTCAGGRIKPLYCTMFKCGDDLRQDMLVIQLLQVMNNIWLSQNMNLCMKLYSVIPTGPLEGMVEIVEDSVTLAKITSEYGGSTAAFSKKPIANWLYKQLDI